MNQASDTIIVSTVPGIGYLIMVGALKLAFWLALAAGILFLAKTILGKDLDELKRKEERESETRNSRSDSGRKPESSKEDDKEKKE